MNNLYRIETILHGKADSFPVEAPNEMEAREIAESELCSAAEVITEVVFLAAVVNS